MARADDRSEKHLEWLVSNRSDNQRSTLRLHTLLTNTETLIATNIVYCQLAQELAAVAFSLWRAVFLSDVTETPEDAIADARSFLGTLIANNAIGYPQDRNAREWTFSYYLGDARTRLEGMAIRSPSILSLSDLEAAAQSSKEDWEIAQRALERAIVAFERLLSS